MKHIKIFEEFIDPKDDKFEAAEFTKNEIALLSTKGTVQKTPSWNIINFNALKVYKYNDGLYKVSNNICQTISDVVKACSDTLVKVKQDIQHILDNSTAKVITHSKIYGTEVIAYYYENVLWGYYRKSMPTNDEGTFLNIYSTNPMGKLYMTYDLPIGHNMKDLVSEYVVNQHIAEVDSFYSGTTYNEKDKLVKELSKVPFVSGEFFKK